MKKLFPYSGKEVEVELKNGRKYQGYIWRYHRTYLLKDGDYEYYIGYDGGMMELIKPSEVINIKELK